MVLHPALSFEYGSGARALAEIDVATSVTTILQMARDSRALNEPATSPAVATINLVHPALPWSITVHPLNAAVTYVTVTDVLRVICQSLQLPLREEYWSFCSGAGGRTSERRRDPRNLKRMDLLNGKRSFVGLSRSAVEAAIGGEVWLMNFA